MSMLKVQEVKGFSKANAVENVDFLDVKYDATAAWKKEGSPIMGKALREFAAKYIDKKLRGVAGVGCIITVEPGKADSRERPYTLTNIPTEGARKYKTFYNILEKETGAFAGRAEQKSKAMDLAKKLTTDNKKSYVGKLVKEVIEGQEDAFICDYTPSISTKQGTYIVFGLIKGDE